MNKSIFGLFKSFARPKYDSSLLHAEEVKELSKEAVRIKYEMDDIIGAAVTLRNLLERYGKRKKKDHRHKGRDFISFILSSKHQDLKNIGYTHWQNLNKVIHLHTKTVYPYHKQNVKNAMDFFFKEIRSL